LKQDIDDSILVGKKYSAVFVNLTAACNTTWHRSFTCKLLWLLPDRHMAYTRGLKLRLLRGPREVL